MTVQNIGKTSQRDNAGVDVGVQQLTLLEALDDDGDDDRLLLQLIAEFLAVVRGQCLGSREYFMCVK